MKYLIYLVGALCLLASPVFAQNEYNYRFQQEYFFGNLPYAKTEAMGGADVAIGGTVNSIFLNPAGLGLIDNQEIAFSTSAPFYALIRSDYYFFGYGRKINDKLTLGLSLNQIAIGPTSFSANINFRSYPTDFPKTTNLTLTAVYEVIENLQVGLNVNRIELKYFDDAPNASDFQIDLGAIYAVPLQENSRLQFGLSMANITGGSALLTAPDGQTATSTYPVTGRIAAAYILNSKMNLPGAGEGDFDFTATIGYQNVFNSEYRNTIRFGTEAVFWKAIALRMGFFTQNVDDLNNPTVNRSRINDFTYGFGLIVPLKKLTNGSLPFDAHIDITSQKQPSFRITGGRRLPNMRAFGLRLVWPLGEDS